MVIAEKQLGISEIQVAPLGIGTMAWSNSSLWGYGSKLSRSDVEAAFAACLDSGLTLFDTAEIYGFGHSEKVLGSLVRETVQPVQIATKYAPYPWRFSASAVLKAVDHSLQRLGVETIDLYQVHFPGGFVSIDELMNALADAVLAGKIRTIGVSNYSADEMRKAHRVLMRRGIPLAANQVEYSLVQRAPEVDGVLDACRELNVTLIAYSPLGRGVLTGKYQPGDSAPDARRFMGQFKDAQLADMQPLLAALQAIGEAHGGKSSAQVALNWLARQPQVLPIPGAKNEKQARDNAAAISWSMTDEEAAQLDELSRPFRQAKGGRF